MLTTLTPFDIYLQALGPVSVCGKNPHTDALDLYLRSFGISSTPSILEVVADIGIPTSGLRPESMLRSYQNYLADEIERREYLLGAAEMSLGKTGATLTGVRRLLRKNPTWRCIVVAPLKVAEETWPTEIGEWEHLQDMTYTVVIGDAAQRAAALAVDADLTIINRENLQWLWETVGGDAGWRWQILVYDESSRLKGFTFRTPNKKKDPKTGQTIRKKPNLTEFGVLAQARKNMERVIELSGTPSPNGVYDLGGQSYLMDQGERLGINKTQFEKRFFDKNPFTHEVKPKEGAKDKIMGLMKDCMISLRSQDYIDLPPQIFNPRFVTLAPKYMKQYRDFEKTLVAESYDVEAVSRGVLTNKLLQFCIAGGTEVLTDAGWLKIESVTKDHKIWDGVEWVSCKGNIFNGFHQTVDCYGVSMTKEHNVLTVDGWHEAKDVLYDDASIRVDRAEVRLPHSITETRYYDRESSEGNLALSMRLRDGSGSHIAEPAASASSYSDTELRVQTRGGDLPRARRSLNDKFSTIQNLDTHEISLQKPEGQRFQELRSKGYRYARRMVQLLQSVLARCSGGLCESSFDRSRGEHAILFEGQLPLDDQQTATAKHQSKRSDINKVGNNHLSGGGGTGGIEVRDSLQTTWARGDGRIPDQTGRIAVYDLVDCGPRNRFVVRGSDGPVIVHNCNGSLYRTDEDVYPPVRETIPVHDAKIKELESIVEESAGQNVLVAYSFKFDKERIRKKFPKAVFFDEEPNFVKKWNAGKIQMGVSHPASMAHGLNLQYGGFIQVWYGLTWSLELWDQFNRRLARPGQPHPSVFIHVIMAKGTMDEVQYETLRTKGVTQDEIMDAVRVRLKS